jgi:hypothetical protein
MPNAEKIKLSKGQQSQISNKQSEIPQTHCLFFIGNF